jgi:hypothetical protein
LEPFEHDRFLDPQQHLVAREFNLTFEAEVVVEADEFDLW